VVVAAVCLSATASLLGEYRGHTGQFQVVVAAVCLSATASLLGEYRGHTGQFQVVVAAVWWAVLDEFLTLKGQWAA